MRVALVVSSGLNGSTEDVGESGTLVFEVFSAATGEESDEEEDEADYGDAADYAAGYGDLVYLSSGWFW